MEQSAIYKKLTEKEGACVTKLGQAEAAMEEAIAGGLPSPHHTHTPPPPPTFLQHCDVDFKECQTDGVP